MQARRGPRATFRRRHPGLFRCGVGLVAGVLCYSGPVALNWYRHVNSYRYLTLHPPLEIPVEARAGFARMLQHAAFRAEWTGNTPDLNQPVSVLSCSTLRRAFPTYCFIRFRNGTGRTVLARTWAVSTTGGEPWCFDSATAVGDFLADSGFVVANPGDADKLSQIIHEILPEAVQFCNPDAGNLQIDRFQWRIGVKQDEQLHGETFFEVNLDERGAVECGTIVFKPAIIDDRITPAKARPTPPHPATPPAAPTKLPK